MLIQLIEKFGAIILRQLESLGRIVLFFLSGVINIFVLPFQFKKIIDHLWFIGSKSVFVIVLTGFFTGMVLGLQGYYSLVKFGSEAALGSAVALTLIRELGPVFGARGVSLSTTNAVVQSCIYIFIFDYIITFFLV